MNSTTNPAAFVTKAEILQHCKGAEPWIEGFDESLFTPWAYDLRVGSSYLATKDEHSDLEGAIVSIEPGEFALLLTQETVNIPGSHVGFISLKFTQALKGLVNVSGFHVDPGYSGKILFSVYNAGPNPVTLRHGDALFMIVFAPLSQTVDVSERKRRKTIIAIEASHISQVRGASQSLVALGQRVDKLEHRIEFLIGLLVAVVTGAILALLRLA